MNFVLGARGRLGRAIVASSELGESIALDHSVYVHWTRDGAADDVARYFENNASPRSAGYVFVAAGIIDPSRSAEEHLSVNYLLARNVVEGAHKCGLRVVTFGSAMEAIAGEDFNNSYL